MDCPPGALARAVVLSRCALDASARLVVRRLGSDIGVSFADRRAARAYDLVRGAFELVNEDAAKSADDT